MIEKNRKISIATSKNHKNRRRGMSRFITGALLFLLATCLHDTHAEVFNVREFGAVGDGQTDDTVALQAAIDKAANSGTVLIPAGNYLVSKTLVIARTTGLIICGEGTGGIRGPYHPAASASGTTSLTWNGKKGGVLLESRGNGGLLLEKLNLNGSTPDESDGAQAGILFHVTRPPGWGDMINRLSNLSFFNADVGIQMGTKASDHNCSDYVFDFITFRGLNTAFRVKNDQGVDYLFNYVFALSVDTVLDFERGGNLQVNTAQMTNCKLFLNIRGGGRNTGTYMVNNVRIESGNAGRAERYQLLKSYPKWRQANVKVMGYDDCQWAWNENQTESRRIPLMDIGPGTMVTVENSIFNGPAASLTGNEEASANLVMRECSFGFIKPEDAVTANEHGYFKLLQNVTDKMQLLPDVVKWPQLDAIHIQQPTHRGIPRLP